MALRTLFTSLRFKLALLYMTVFGVVQSALCISILVARERELHRDFFDALTQKCDLIIAGLETEPAGETPARLFSSPALISYFIQTSLPDGTVLQRSPELGDHVLPWTEPSESEPMQIMTGSLAKALAEGGDLAVLPVAHVMPDGSIVRVQIARSLAGLNHSISDLRRIIFIALGFALLVSSAASMFLAKRSLAPIGRLAQQASNIVATDLDKRLDRPGSADEVAELASVLNDMLDRLERAFRAQEHFIADVAHELKTPITILLAEAQLIADSPDLQRHQSFAINVRDELHRLTSVIDSLLMLTRAESGIPLEDPGAVQIAAVIDDAIRQCRAHAALYKVRLERGGSNADELCVSGDVDLLAAAVANLIRNAVRFSPEGDSVRIEASGDESQATIEVRDKGSGIDPTHMPHIFQRFYRGQTGDDRRSGSGLGLAIAKAIVQLHHGEILAENGEKIGCAFRISLPLYTVETQQLP